MRVPIAILALACALLAAAPPAGAQADSAADAAAEREREELTRKYERAQEHYLAKRYTEALPLFEEVARGLDSPNAMLYVARCLREMGRLVEAHAEMKRTLKRATERAASEPRFAPTRDAAATELREVETRVGRVAISMLVPPAGTTVEINGRRLEPLDEVAAVMPGRVRIEAAAPGRAPLRQEIDVAAGALQTVALQFAEPAAPPPSTIPSASAGAPPQPPPPSPDKPPARSWTDDGSIRFAGYFVAGAGIAGWATMAVAGLMAKEHFEDIQVRCGTARCTDPDDNDIIDDGRQLDLIANVGLGVGAVGVVVGGLMIILGGASDDGSASVSGALDTHGGWFGYRGRF